MQNLALGLKEEKFNAKIPFSFHLFSFRFFFSLSFPVLSNNALHIMQYKLCITHKEWRKKATEGKEEGWFGENVLGNLKQMFFTSNLYLNTLHLNDERYGIEVKQPFCFIQ